MVHWVLDFVNTDVQLPAYVIVVIAAAYPIINWAIKLFSFVRNYRFQNKLARHADGFERDSNEWVVGHVSYLSDNKASGFIDSGSGRKNAYFPKGAISEDTVVLLGQHVRFLADWSKPQPIVRSVKPLPKQAVKCAAASKALRQDANPIG